MFENAADSLPEQGSDPAHARSQPASSGRSPSTGGTPQELRIAVALTGGVSLAVWMGGIAQELNSLTQASGANRRGLRPESAPSSADDAIRGYYQKLLGLLDVDVDIDVLCGSSAGGVNAALLGYSLANRKALKGLRDTWLQVGALTELLRDPREKDPLSLMDGDKSIYTGVEDQLTAMKKQQSSGIPGPPGSDPRDPDVTVLLTTTFLEGETSRFTDSYGTVVQDTDHHGLFTFTGKQLVNENVVTPLALAARSSASFPGAFEASYLPYEQDAPANPPDDRKGPPLGQAKSRPKMKAYTNATRPHWTVDGGLLANRPLQPMLETIFDRQADREVRRVLLYVVPSAGPLPSALDAPDELTPKKPPSLRTALAGDLKAVFEQSIASDLRSIQRHNSNVDTLTDTRLQLAAMATRLHGPLLTMALVRDYAKRQGAAVIRPVIAEMMKLISTATTTPGAHSVLPVTWIPLICGNTNVEEDCRRAALKEVTKGWENPPTTFAELEKFGRPASDGVRTIILSIVRHALALTDGGDDRRAILDLKTTLNAATDKTPRPDITAIVETAIAKSTTPTICATVAAREYFEQLSNCSALDRWERVCDELSAMRSLLSGLTAIRCENPGVPDDQKTFADPHADALHCYLRYLFAHQGKHPQTGLDILLRLFDLHAAQRALTPIGSEVEQRLELIQVSADTRTTLDPVRRTAASKLTGMQFQHFGAFFKASWRANDWMWGRVDGVGWLIHMLLDPARLRRAAEGIAAGPLTKKAVHAKVDWLYDQLRAIAGEDPPGFNLAEPDQPDKFLDEKLVRTELKAMFPLDAHVSPPASLPFTALWMAARPQQLVAVSELPVLATQLTAESKSGRWTDTTSWTNEVMAASTAPGSFEAQAGRVVANFASNPVPQQTLKAEVGNSQLNLTVTKAAATGTAALAAFVGNSGPLKPFLSTMQTAAMTGYRLAVATKATVKALLLSGLAAMIIGVLLVSQQSMIFGVAGVAVIMAGCYLLALGVWGIGPTHLKKFAGIMCAVVLMLPIIPLLRELLFGAADQPGVAHHWMTWVGQEWWRPAVVVLAAAVLLSAAWSAGKRSNRAPKPPARQTMPAPESRSIAGMDAVTASYAGR